MATILEQADGIRAALATITTLRAYAEEPDEVQVGQGKAVAFPLLREIAYDEAFDGGAVYTWDVVVLAAPESAGRVRGQRAVDPYVAPTGASSVVAALYADSTLGGVVDWVKANRAYDRGLNTVSGGVSYWGAKVEIQTQV